MADAIAYTPHELGSAEAQAALNTTHSSGARYPTRGLTEKSTPVNRFHDEGRRAHLLLERVAHLMELHAERDSAGALKLAVNKGRYTKSDHTVVEFAGATIDIPDATTGRLVWIDVSANTLDQGAAWPSNPWEYVAIADVDTAGGAITNIRDARGVTAYRLVSPTTDSGATDYAEFVTDNDNAGAGVDGGLRHNRGTSGGGEDAAVRWVEASVLWRLLAQHTTGTLAALDVLKLLIGGTEIIDDAGKLLQAAIDATTAYDFALLRITPSGSSGAPSSGTHSKGELAIDTNGVIYVCTADGTPGTWSVIGNQATALSAGVVTTTALSDAIADTLPVVDMPDVSGGGASLTLALQIKDKQGANLAEAVYVQVGVYADADAAAEASGQTISNSPTAGSFIRWVSTDKVAVYKTSAAGLLQVAISLPSPGTVYALAAPTTGSRALDCSDKATVTRS